MKVSERRWWCRKWFSNKENFSFNSNKCLDCYAWSFVAVGFYQTSVWVFRSPAAELLDSNCVRKKQLTLSFLLKSVLRICRIIVKRLSMTSPQPWNQCGTLHSNTASWPLSCSMATNNLLHSCYDTCDFHELKPNFRCYLQWAFLPLPFNVGYIKISE